MGGADCICSDKTGTLTTNVMEVRAMWLDGKGRNLDIEAKANSPQKSANEVNLDAVMNAARNTFKANDLSTKTFEMMKDHILLNTDVMKD